MLITKKTFKRGPERYQIERAFIEAPMALGTDIYSIGADLINSEQTGRLVQKALQRSNLYKSYKRI